MITILFVFFIRFFLALFIILLGFNFCLHLDLDREKGSPFECGFDPKGSGRVPFSTRFFLLVVIFLVFDVEVALLIPLPLLVWTKFTLESILGCIFFIIILILGLLHEWKEGSLDWKE